MLSLVLFLLLVILLLLILLAVFLKKSIRLEQALQEALFSKSSQAVKHGKIIEQFAPFIGGLPFSPSNFRFIGSPIDGLAFEEDAIIFCEFKAGESKLSPLQQKIKRLVEKKRVKWLEVALRENQ